MFNNTNTTIPTGDIVMGMPGLLADDVALIAHHDGVYAVMVNKTAVITGSLAEAEQWFGDTDYTVANVELPVADEVIDLSDSGIDTTDGGIRAFQLVAQLALIAGEAGPRAEKWLTLVVADDSFAHRMVSRKGQTVRTEKLAA